MHFCIIGTGRCGTTLLAKLLNLHKDVFIFNETHWIVKMYEKFGTRNAYPHELLDIIQNTFHITDLPTTNFESPQLKPLLLPNSPITIREFCDSIGNSFAKEQGKKLWADKTPDYGPFMHIIQRIWPNCKFVHLIRHGADVAASMSTHLGYQWLASANEDNWAPVSYNKYYKAVPITQQQPMKKFGALWYRRLQRIRNESQMLSPGSYQEFFFEQLVTTPEKTLKTMAEFINIPYYTPWVGKCNRIIDKKRVTKRMNSRKMDFFEPHEIDLLQELGYE